MQFLPIDTPSKTNFETLVDAITEHRICLLSAFDQHTHEPVFMVCAVNPDPDIQDGLQFVPLATLCTGNPYERFLPATDSEKPLPNAPIHGTIRKGFL